MAELPPEFAPHVWVYIGPCDGKTETIAEFRDVETESSRYYSLKKVKKAVSSLTPGMVFSVQASDTQADLTSLTYKSLWHDADDRARWQTAARAYNAEQTLRQRAARESRDDALLEILRPLRREYQETNGQNKIALEILVVRALRTPVK